MDNISQVTLDSELLEDQLQREESDDEKKSNTDQEWGESLDTVDYIESTDSYQEDEASLESLDADGLEEITDEEYERFKGFIKTSKKLLRKKERALKLIKADLQKEMMKQRRIKSQCVRCEQDILSAKQEREDLEEERGLAFLLLEQHRKDQQLLLHAVYQDLEDTESLSNSIQELSNFMEKLIATAASFTENMKLALFSLFSLH